MNKIEESASAARAKRSKAVATAVASMRLEGFVPSHGAAAINDRYVAGEIDAVEQEQQILALAGRVFAARAKQK